MSASPPNELFPAEEQNNTRNLTESQEELSEIDLELSTDPLEVRETIFTPANLTDNAKTVLDKRYLMKDPEGKVKETPKDLFLRVANAIALAEENYGGEKEEIAKKFYRLMASLDFLPNSPTLMNAGRSLGQLSACFVLPIEDSMEGIFETVKNTAMIHKSGGGTGFSFSRLRPKDSSVRSTAGTASGPVSFMSVFNTATETVKQGGTRRGANMAILRVDHPDILDFITCKTGEFNYTNFNISVAVTDKFMDAVNSGFEYKLISPHTSEVVRELPARDVFDKIVEGSWRNGEPGIVFIDKINNYNPTPELGEIESTNPCGEQPLLPYESCNLGSINLDHMVKDGDIDWSKLRDTIHTAVHFLDNVIDMNQFPLKEIAEMTRKTRKIGLGVMGFADMLYQLGIPYDSDQGITKAEEVMSFFRKEARQKSKELAKERGLYPAWREGKLPQRNSTVTTIAPTGTISMIADSSGGIEPNFSLAYTKNVLDGQNLHYLNKHFKNAAEEGGFYSEELVKKLADGENLDSIEEIPPRIKKIFRTSRDIDAIWHIRMQATFQKYTDNAVSKTINFANSATKEDIANAFQMAYRMECKGLTVYRDGAREVQVLESGKKSKDKEKPEKASPRPRNRPRLTYGVTERVITGEGTLYVTINEDSAGLCEVFASIGKHGGNVAAQSEAIGRLISLALRCGIDARSIINQLKGIAGPNQVWEDGQLILSTPDAIGKVLERYISRKEEKEKTTVKTDKISQSKDEVADTPKPYALGESCPDCGGIVVLEEGCATCHSCGYSRCG
jgi:ribonucleoside-diphosphate reductase alpha chain